MMRFILGLFIIFSSLFNVYAKQGICSVFSTYSILGTIIEKQTKKVESNGIKYTVKVISALSGTDVILTNGTSTKNITLTYPGENLFPQVFESKNGFFVSWIQYRKGNVKLYLYDSNLDVSRNLIADNFCFIGNAKPLYWRGNLRALIFLGLNKDNDDIYLYDLIDDLCINVSNTSGFEKKFKIEIIDRDIILKTETNNRCYEYSLEPESLKIKLIKFVEKKSIVKKNEIKLGYDAYNKMVAFGDSVTWGKIRMNEFKSYSSQRWIEVEHHPELTYWGQLTKKFNDDYKNVLTTSNLGINGDTSLAGKERMNSEFSKIEGYFCFIMFGTNDVGGNTASMLSVAENLEWIVNNAKNRYNMYPIIMTVPPQQNKRRTSEIQYYKENTEYLNTLIIKMAIRNNVPYVDTYKAFFEAEEGWSACLEDYKGNHPSPLGHKYIADLIEPIILSLPPKKLEEFNTELQGDYLVVYWNKNIEFDFDHYEVQYSLKGNQLNRRLTTFEPYCTLYNKYFHSNVKFKIRAVDRLGNKSPFYMVYEYCFPYKKIFK